MSPAWPMAAPAARGEPLRTRPPPRGTRPAPGRGPRGRWRRGTPGPRDPLRPSVPVEQLRDLAGLQVHLHCGGLDDLDVPLEERELLLLQPVRGHGEERDRLAR